MRRTITTLLVLSLIGGAFAAPAANAAKKKKKPKRVERTAEGTYDLPAIGAGGLGICFPGTIGCIAFGATAEEKFIEVSVKDQLGQNVYASVSQDIDGDNRGDQGFNICGSTTEPMPIEPGVEVIVFIWEGPGIRPPCAGASSSGKVTVTFSNLP